MICDCGQPLLASISIGRGHCEHCELHGPAPTFSRALAAPAAVEVVTSEPESDDEAEPRKRRSAAAPPPPGPPCVYCGQLTHARTQRDDAGQPAHLMCCTGDHLPSVGGSGLATAEDAAADAELAARVGAVEVCEHGRPRLPVWVSGDSTVLAPALLWAWLEGTRS